MRTARERNGEVETNAINPEIRQIRERGQGNDRLDTFNWVTPAFIFTYSAYFAVELASLSLSTREIREVFGLMAIIR